MPVRIIWRAAAAGTAFLAAAAMASCGSSGLLAGPFAEPRIPSVQCEPLAGHQLATDGDEAVRNHGTATAVIDKVALARAKGLLLERAWAVPTTAQLEGMSWGAPPPPYHLLGWHWGRRHLGKGARVPPSTGKYDRTNLLVVVALAPGVTRGTAAGIDIWYHVGANHYHLRTKVALVVINRKSC